MRIHQEKLLADRRRYLLKAIRRCGSQEKLAARTGLKRSRINYLLNRAKGIRYEEASLIAGVAEGGMHPLQLADHVDQLNPNLKPQLAADSRSFQALKISERVRLAQDYEAQLKQQPLGTVTGRLEIQAAKMAALRNYKTYQQAKKVLQFGIPELVTAMDEERLKIFTLFNMAHYTPEQQRELLNGPRREINAWMRQHPAPTPSPVASKSDRLDKKQSFLLSAQLWLSPALVTLTAHPAAAGGALFHLLVDRRLYQAECRSGWPLRLLCVCLGHFADPQGCVAKEWETLCRLLLADGRHLAAAIQELIALDWLRESPFEGESSA